MSHSIAVVVLTHNRLHLLRKCVEVVLARASSLTTEIVIWDNASTDGTGAFLDRLSDPRITVVHNAANIGQNAYAEAFRQTRASHLLELDDDVIDAPPEWDRRLLEAFVRLPQIGYLSANVEDDPNDTLSRTMRERAHLYSSVEVGGLRLLKGPVSGACTMTSRDLLNRAGGFPTRKGQVFWLEDQAYIEKIGGLGFEAAFLQDLRVHHAGGPFYAEYSPEKRAFWEAYARMVGRKVAVKRVLLSLPLVSRMNARYRWFQPPGASC